VLDREPALTAERERLAGATDDEARAAAQIAIDAEAAKSATERMIEFAATLTAGGAKKEESLEWREQPVGKPQTEHRYQCAQNQTGHASEATAQKHDPQAIRVAGPASQLRRS
jgi:cobalamin-dependent methionine synthase I